MSAEASRDPAPSLQALIDRLLDEAETPAVSLPDGEAAPAAGGDAQTQETLGASSAVPASAEGRAADGPAQEAAEYVSAGETTDRQTAAPQSASSAPPPGSIMSGLLAHPEILTALPTLLQTLGPLLRPRPSDQTAASEGAEDGQTDGSAVPASALPAPRPAPPKGRRPPNRHVALLCALKPYLSRERSQAVDMLVQVCRLLDAVQDMGLFAPPPRKEDK